MAKQCAKSVYMNELRFLGNHVFGYKYTRICNFKRPRIISCKAQRQQPMRGPCSLLSEVLPSTKYPDLLFWGRMRGSCGKKAAGNERRIRAGPGHEGRPASHRVESAGPCDRPSVQAGEGAKTHRGRSSCRHPLHASIVFL